MNTLTFIIAAVAAVVVYLCTRYIGISNLQGKKISDRKKMAIGFGIATFVVVVVMGILGE